MEIDKKRIEDAIIADVANGLISDEALYSRVKTAVDDRINKLFADKAERQIAEAIEKAIALGFEHEYCRTDSFGRKVGEPTTISKELEKAISGYWNTKVDRSGKPSSDSYNTVTRAEWSMLQIASDSFDKEMKQNIVNLGGKLKDALRLELHETTNKLLSEVFSVKSLGDQKEDRRDRSMIMPPAN